MVWRNLIYQNNSTDMAAGNYSIQRTTMAQLFKRTLKQTTDIYNPQFPEKIIQMREKLLNVIYIRLR